MRIFFTALACFVGFAFSGCALPIPAAEPKGCACSAGGLCECGPNCQCKGEISGKDLVLVAAGPLGIFGKRADAGSCAGGQCTVPTRTATATATPTATGAGQDVTVCGVAESAGGMVWFKTDHGWTFDIRNPKGWGIPFYGAHVCLTGRFPENCYGCFEITKAPKELADISATGQCAVHFVHSGASQQTRTGPIRRFLQRLRR